MSIARTFSSFPARHVRQPGYALGDGRFAVVVEPPSPTEAVAILKGLRDRYEALSTFGLLLSVALQAMVHVQVVSGLAPPKGMTLPFLSDGGTSLIVSSFAVGLALGAARKTHEELYPCTQSNATA